MTELLLDTISDGCGNVTRQSSPANGARYGFTARELDSVTGLQYNRAHWCDLATGRWTGQDPLGFDAGDANWYRYVGNGPTNGKDPRGLDEEGHAVAAGIALALAAGALPTAYGNMTRIATGKFNGGETAFYSADIVEEALLLAGSPLFPISGKDAYTDAMSREKFDNLVKGLNNGKYVPATVGLQSGVKVMVAAAFSQPDANNSYYWHQVYKVQSEGALADKLPQISKWTVDREEKVPGQDHDETNKVLMLGDRPGPIFGERERPDYLLQKSEDGKLIRVRPGGLKDADYQAMVADVRKQQGEANTTITYTFVTELKYGDPKEAIIKGKWEWGFTVKYRKDGPPSISYTKVPQWTPSGK
jgi:RHS repeat-associated protein